MPVCFAHRSHCYLGHLSPSPDYDYPGAVNLSEGLMDGDIGYGRESLQLLYHLRDITGQTVYLHVNRSFTLVHAPLQDELLGVYDVAAPFGHRAGDVAQHPRSILAYDIDGYAHILPQCSAMRLGNFNMASE